MHKQIALYCTVYTAS